MSSRSPRRGKPRSQASTSETAESEPLDCCRALSAMREAEHSLPCKVESMAAADAVSVIAGAALAELIARSARGLPAEYQMPFYAAGLMSAAAVYPVARRRWQLDRRSTGELLGVLGYGAVSLLAARGSRPRANRLLAAGWASHALFDAAHGHDESSRLPRWYPALCAGYDLVICGHLARAA